MQYFEIMKSLESSNSLYKYFPNNFLLEQIVCLLVLANLLKHITIIRIFHHYTVSFKRTLILTKENLKAHQKKPVCMKPRFNV